MIPLWPIVGSLPGRGGMVTRRYRELFRRWSAFFELFSLLIEPVFFCFWIFLSGSFPRFDRAIAKLAENPRAMARCVVDLKVVFDQRSNSLGCPEICFPTVDLCPLFEQLVELLSILVIKF